MAVKTRHSDLYNDVEKIKAALFTTANDVKGKAGEIINDSMESVKERSELMKENVADYTAKKPFKTLGAVFLIGTIIGFLLRNK